MALEDPLHKDSEGSRPSGFRCGFGASVYRISGRFADAVEREKLEAAL